MQKMQKKIIIGKIYANWCGHCQQLKPEWQKMKTAIPIKQYEIIEIEESEVPRLDEFKQRFPLLEVSGYPTIFKIHPNNRIEYYTGARDSNNIKKWVIKNNRTTKHKLFRKKNKTMKKIHAK